MSLGRLPPKQFNFFPFWLNDFKSLRSKPAFLGALEGLEKTLVDIAEDCYESDRESDPEFAREEYDLRLHEARVRTKDLHWLRDSFEGIDLYALALAIANELYPGMNWEVLICEESAVVTNLERSLVFDMKNFDKLSGGASLLFVEDPQFEGTPSQQAEADKLIDAQIQRDLHMLNTMKNAIDKDKSTPPKPE